MDRGNIQEYLSGSYRESFVSYSCGSCGYELNLSSSNRNTASIGSKYGKSMKRGMISFYEIDETRFMKVDEIRCIPYFISKKYWGLFRRRTKLLCQKCGNHIGDAYDVKGSTYPATKSSASPTTGEVARQRKFNIKIRTVQPSSSHQAATPLVI